MKTTNFEISKQLFEAGFRAGTKELAYNENYTRNGEEPYPSYDLETLLEAPPKLNDRQTYLLHPKGVGYLPETGKPVELWINRLPRESLADTAGRLLLLLIEKKIIDPKTEIK